MVGGLRAGEGGLREGLLRKDAVERSMRWLRLRCKEDSCK